MSRNNSKEFTDYYLGLDIGTDSVGWCVTDFEYNVLKFNGKAMWGIRLFDAASSAADRRAFRTSRRRLQRRKKRIELIQRLLAEEINKCDPMFYLRLKESKFYLEDKKEEVRQPFCLFADTKYTDVEYHKDYPTIYHLRNSLIKHEKKYDIRLYYLAIAYFMKHRGHFLYQGDVSEATSFDAVFNDLKDYINLQFDMQLETQDIPMVKKVLLDSGMGKIEKKRRLNELFNTTSNMQKEALAAICGATVSIDKLFEDESFKEAEINKLSFSDGLDDGKSDKLLSVLGEKFEYISKLKAVYDWSVLTNILSGCDSISEAQIKVYEKHKKDLRDLKYVIRKYMKEQYKEIFVYENVENNYASYVGHVSSGKKALADKRTYLQKDFCDYIKKKIADIDADDAVLTRIKEETANYTFMPKQVSKSNSAIPYQIHLQELKKIVENMGKDYPALMQKDVDGYSVCDKIIKIFTFRIPYFVGPLNIYHSDKGGNSWAVRKEKGEVFPWNFDKKIDQKASAEAFINRLTNTCTYLVGEDVLPKNSLLYSKYMVLNELNNVRINGNRLDVNVKQKIYNVIFEKKAGKYSLKKLKSWLIKENIIEENDVLSGIDEVFQASLKSYQDFYKIIGEKVETEVVMIDDIIKDIVIFGEDKKLLKERIFEKYGSKLTSEEINKISKLSYNGWGNFSYKLLSEIEDVDHETGESRTIIQEMWNGQENFMELMSSKHEYAERIREHNLLVNGDEKEIRYELVSNSYASPAVKRGIWQTLLIVKEITRITGKEPKRLFIETARAKEDNPRRTNSRKAQLLEIYKAIKNEEKDWVEEINKKEEKSFNSKKLYLYYTQMGRDMYSGKEIDLSELFTNAYDIDHIYPQSKTKDDSLLNNLVLVRSEENRDKEDIYPVPDKYRQAELWSMLLKAGGKGLITKEKYDRLMRREPLSEEELASFISRQLVETRQTTKVVAQILEQVFPKTKIVYSKANGVSDFRRDNGFIKARSVNDYHHAKDAYLNIVVGNVYYTKFTDNPVKFIRNGKEKYSLNRMFDFDVQRNGIIAWVQGENGTIKTVRKYMNKNNILFTRYATEKRGGYFDQMPLKKGKGQLLPLKCSDKRYDVTKYGGYNKPSIDYFMLVESEGKRGRIRTLEGVPVYLSSAGDERILEFCESREGLGLKNPKIIYKKIRINSLIKIDGYPMHISGKSGSSILAKNAVQLCLDNEMEKLIHDIDKVIEKKKNDKYYKVDEHDGVDDEKITKLYDFLTYKAQNSIYSKRPGTQAKTLQNGKEKFNELGIYEKAKVISEIIKLFQCKTILPDLTLIGGAANAGKFSFSRQISNNKSVILIDQSITGMFEKERNLLE